MALIFITINSSTVVYIITSVPLLIARLKGVNLTEEFSHKYATTIF